MEQLEQDIRDRLAGDIDPYLGCDLVSAGAIRAITVDGRRATVDIELGFPIERYRDELIARLEGVLGDLADAEITFDISARILAREVQKGTKPLPEVRNIIAVASGKGGVGKSTVAANLACALAAEGRKVGLLDADVYGPSQPKMLGISGRPTSPDGQMILPLRNHGVTLISIGLMTSGDQAVVWRGPMLMGALQQMMSQVQWGALDVLIVDLPPGTGDVQMTLSQKFIVDGAIIVSTPQDVALLDARKGIDMFQQMQVPIIGMIENMSTHICSNCGHEEHVFGHGGVAAEAEKLGVPLLAEIPLHLDIRLASDGGAPIVVSQPDSPQAQAFREVARKLIADGVA